MSEPFDPTNVPECPSSGVNPTEIVMNTGQQFGWFWLNPVEEGPPDTIVYYYDGEPQMITANGSISDRRR